MSGIEFIDPDTGQFHTVEGTKAAVDAAWDRGWMPATDDDFGATENIDAEADE